MITRFLVGTLIAILVIWGAITFFTWIGQEDEIAVPVNVTNVEEIADAVNDDRDQGEMRSEDAQPVIGEAEISDDDIAVQSESYSGTVPQGRGVYIVGKKITGTAGGLQVSGDQGVFIALPSGASYDVEVVGGNLYEVPENELKEKFENCVSENRDEWHNLKIYQPTGW